MYLAALFPLNPLLSFRYNPLVMSFFPLYFLLYFIFWRVDGKVPCPFFSLCRCLMLLFSCAQQKGPCRAVAWLWLQRSLFLLHPVLPCFSTIFSPQSSVLNWLVSFPYLVLFWLYKPHLSLLSSFSTLNHLLPSHHKPSDHFLQQPAFLSTVTGSNGSLAVLFILPV